MATLVTGIGSLSLSVTGGSGNGVSPITLNVSAVPSSVEVGQLITVAGVTGNTNANGDKTVTAVTSTSITFAGTGNGTVSGGTITRKYATVEAWNTATSGAIGGNVKIGELYADSVFEQLTPTALVLSGATGTLNSSTAYRKLRAWSGHSFVPRLNSGVKIRRAINEAAGVTEALRVAENYFRLEGLCVELVDSNSGVPSFNHHVIRCTTEYAYLLGCTVDGSGWTRTADTVGLVGLELKGGSYAGFCAVIGPADDSKSAVLGVYLQNSTATTGLLTNLTVYGWQNTAGATGLYSTHNTIQVTNCAIFRTSDNAGEFDLVVPTGLAFNCALGSEDASGLSTGCETGLAVNSNLCYPEFKDLRPIAGSQLGTQLGGLQGVAVFSTDIEGNVLPSGATDGVLVGCHNTTTEPQATRAITHVESTIGAGGDYTTIAEWVTATSLHLVGLDERHTGYLLDSSYNEQVVISGATTDARRYRRLEAYTNNEYDPINAVGSVVFHAVSAGCVLSIAEDFAEVAKIRFNSTYSGAAASSGPDVVRITANDVLLERCVAAQASTTGSVATACYEVLSAGPERATFRNCVALGGSSATTGATLGFHVSGSGSKVQNCLATRVRRGTAGTGYYCTVNGVTFENCVAGTSDVGFDVPVGSQRYNASVDATAAGVGSLASITLASCFYAASSDDFRLIVDSPLIGAGVALDLQFTDDFAGTSRLRPWSIGPYTTVVLPPLYPSNETKVTHRYVPLWKVRTQRGDVLLFSGHDTNLTFNGETYSAQNGLDSSAFRAEGGLRDHQTEAFGFLSDDRVTFEDLDSGLYENARVDVYLVDWRYPWLTPFHRTVFFLRRIRFDGEVWRAEAEGLASVLKKTIGGVYSPICRHEFGSPNPNADGEAGCGLDASLFTEFDVEVDTVSEEYRVFQARITAPNELPSTSDGYFEQGRLTFTSGANTNLSFDVALFTNASREITLVTETPFPIVAGDRFNLTHGDDHTIDTCATRFGNQDNFGGQPFIPGAQRIYQTP